MVLTQGQQAGDPSPANQDRYPISTGNPMVALTSNDASGITVSASGDASGSARKPVHGSQSRRLASTLTSTHQLGAQARLSASTMSTRWLQPMAAVVAQYQVARTHPIVTVRAQPITILKARVRSSLPPVWYASRIPHRAFRQMPALRHLRCHLHYGRCILATITLKPGYPNLILDGRSLNSLGCLSLGPPNTDSQSELCQRLWPVTARHPCFTSKHPKT